MTPERNRLRRAFVHIASVGAIILGALAGYWFASVEGILDGLVVGVVTAIALLGLSRWLDSSQTIRRLADRRRPERDWMTLLNHEKCHYAQQLERDGAEEEAERIYRYLVKEAYAHPLPYQQLAALHRANRETEHEVEVLEKAIHVLSRENLHTSTAWSRKLPQIRRRLEELTSQ